MECNGCRVGLRNFGLFGKVVAPIAVKPTPYYINLRMSDKLPGGCIDIGSCPSDDDDW